MNMLEFLTAVWPEQGNYCLATPMKWTDPKTGKEMKGYKHFVSSNIRDIFQQAKLLRTSKDIFFCVHTLKENLKKGKREHTNMARARSLFLDLDVGSKPNQFPTRGEARKGLLAFCVAVGLPVPLLVSSGGGIHCYWTFENDISTKKWLHYATLLYRLVQHHGLKADRSRIKDESSVLRVPRTFNWKLLDEPRPVEVKHVAGPFDDADLWSIIYHACEDAGIPTDVSAAYSPNTPSAAGALGVTVVEFNGKVPAFEQVAEVCGHFRHWEKVGGHLDYNYWHKMLAVARKCTDGREKCHELSEQDYDGYDSSEVEAKMDEQDNREIGPTTCAVLNEVSGNGICAACNLWGICKSPINAPYVPQVTNEPPPAMRLKLGGANETEFEPPDLPLGYKWTKTGVAVLVEKGEKSFWSTVLDYKLFPVTRQTDANGKNDQQVWCARAPNEKPKIVVIPSSVIYDLPNLIKELSGLSIYLDIMNIKMVQSYMIAYIKKLQETTPPESQHTHMGWVENNKAFALGHIKIQRDGSIRPVQYTGNAASFASMLRIGKAGTLEAQVAAMDFYNRSDYLPQQFYIGTALGSLLFHLTGQHGTIVNANGPSGGGKSAMLMAAMAFYGDPRAMYLNATKGVGATPKARSECMFSLHSLPFGLDELSGLDPEAARAFAYEVSQPRGRIGLSSGRSVIMPAGASAEENDVKANIIMTTSNGSLHSILAEGSGVGNATSMRVVELDFPHLDHGRLEAEGMMETLCSNYGHIGEAIIRYVMENYDWTVQAVKTAIAYAERKYHLRVQERFWTSTACATIVALRIAKHLGLLGFDPDCVRDYIFLVLLPKMRGIVVEEYIVPSAALTNLIDDIMPTILVADVLRNINIEQRIPSNQGVKGRFEKNEMLLYLSTDAFHRYCAQRKYPRREFIDRLLTTKVIKGVTRKTLAAGTLMEGGRTQCYVVDMQHAEMAEHADKIIANAEATTPVTTGKPRLTAKDLKVVTAGLKDSA